MSDLSANERSSFGSIRYYNATSSRPKFQPIRVKELANFSDSDDEENEEKPIESEPEDCLEEFSSAENGVCKTEPDGVAEIENLEPSHQKIKGTTQEGLNSVPAQSEHSSNSDNYKDSYKMYSTNYYHIDSANTVQSSSTLYDRAIENRGSSEAGKENHIPVHKTEELLHKVDCHIKCQYTSSKPSTNHRLESSGNIIKSNNYNLQATNTKYEVPGQILPGAEEQTHGESTYNSGKILVSEAGSLGAVDHLAMQTPMKHMNVSCARPNPCFSRRNIAATPCSELHTDPCKSHAVTPATMSSQWPHNNTRQTPLQTRQRNDSLQTPKTSYSFASNAGKCDTLRYCNTDVKPVRRPLVDTMSRTQNDGSIVPLESKSRLFQGSLLSKVDEMSSDFFNDLDMQRNRNGRNSSAKRMLEISEKPAHAETNMNEHLKENKQPVAGVYEIKDKPMQNLDAQSHHLQAHKQDNNPSISSKEADNQFSVLNNQSEQQDLKQIVEKISNVQFSVPTNPKPKQNKILTIKDKKYLVLGELGQGMSGEVFRVQDLQNRELRAIKCVNLSRMDKDSVQGCLEEISMLHKLQAPCVVRMFDYEIKFPMVYVVLEMGDTDLSRLLKSMSQEKHLPLTMILYYWTEMLTAVKYIHDNGVIHSDLKPANFLLVRGRLKLIDFGIASSMNADMTSVVKNCTIGTLNYISPEALMDVGGNGDSPTHKVKYKITFKSDVWSLGCILYSLVYGHTPFHHIRSQWAKVNAITNPKPDISFPTTIPSSNEEGNSVSTPPVLIDVMRKCLQHDPKARPTVAQLLSVQYVPTKPERALPLSRDIPTNVLVKIKHALTEEEWRQLTQILESRRQT